MSDVKKHKWAEIICAWASGESVQFKRTDHALCGWVDFEDNQVSLFGNANLEWRIKPVKRYRVAILSTGEQGHKYPHIAISEAHAQIMEEGPGFVKWLTDWVEYE